MDIRNIVKIVKSQSDTHVFELEDFLPFIANKEFLEADTMGVEEQKKRKLTDLSLAPFCLDKIKRSNVRVIVDDDLKPTIELIKSKAVSSREKIIVI